MRDYRPSLNDLRGRWRACSPVATDEHLEATSARSSTESTSRGRGHVRKLSAATVNKRLDLPTASSRRRSGAGTWMAEPGRGGRAPARPKREHMVSLNRKCDG